VGGLSARGVPGVHWSEEMTSGHSLPGPEAPSLEDALLFIVKYLRDPETRRHTGGWVDYGYELYVPKVLAAYCHVTYRRDPSFSADEMVARALAPPFLDAAWELCRRGILRPGIKTLNLQATSDGSAGAGFSITPFGRVWLNEPEHETFVPTEPERFAKLLEPYRERFGSGFHERAQQALRCYGAHAYLASCAMCGAAAESIMLAAATAKVGEEKATKLYAGANGRFRIEKLLTGQLSDRLRRELQSSTSLLKYWRDASAHGRAVAIDDNEAFTSIALLLRFAASVDENWASLTSGGAG